MTRKELNQWHKGKTRKQRIALIVKAHSDAGNPVTNAEVLWLVDEVKSSWLRGWKSGWKGCNNRRELMDTLGKLKHRVLES